MAIVNDEMKRLIERTVDEREQRKRMAAEQRARNIAERAKRQRIIEYVALHVPGGTPRLWWADFILITPRGKFLAEQFLVTHPQWNTAAKDDLIAMLDAFVAKYQGDVE